MNHQKYILKISLYLKNNMFPPRGPKMLLYKDNSNIIQKLNWF